MGKQKLGLLQLLATQLWMDCLFSRDPARVIIMQKADVYHDAFPHIILCVSFTLFVVFDVSSSYGAAAGSAETRSTCYCVPRSNYNTNLLFLFLWAQSQYLDDDATLGRP